MNKPKHILITGGAGFVGSNLAILFREHFENVQVTALDNLKRRGSEVNIPRLKSHGISFVHSDIRCWEDMESCRGFDLLIDCSAEPSVQAGQDGGTLPVVNNNLSGTVHCMELAKRENAALVFLSTSRVYPISTLNGLPWQEGETRYDWKPTGNEIGLSEEGITEQFPLEGARSLYGATKLSCELLLQEYAYTCNLPCIINRCGILTGPWQMGKVDQGVITLWVARHLFQQKLSYLGFGGTGKQVRDMLHVADLFELLKLQLANSDCWKGIVYNVGGGRKISASLRELTDICRDVTGTTMEMGIREETSPVDLRIYLTDASKAKSAFGWKPSKNVSAIIQDIHRWLITNRELLTPIFG